MSLLWILSSAFQLILYAAYVNSGDMVKVNPNWRRECIYDFYTVIDVKSVGILYRDETSYKHADFLKSISNNGISASVFELPGNVSSLKAIITSWKSLGVHHILFLLKMDGKILFLWLQILAEICDDTWWLFYAEESFRNFFEKNIVKRKCLTERWFVFSSNCMMYEQQNGAFQADYHSDMFQNSSHNYFTEHKVFENIYLQDSQNVIRLAVNESPPYLTLNDINGTVTLKEGPDAEILRMIAKKLRFQYQIMMSPDREWGRLERGEWTGLIGMLSRNEADIAAGCISITYPRYAVSMFSTPYDIQKSVIISEIPSIKPKTYAVLQPFGYDVWLMIFFVLLVVLFLLYGFGIIYGKFYSRKIYKLDRIFWYMIGTICSEGGWLTSKVQGFTTVLLLGLWLLFLIIMQASYSGTLMSVLTFPTYERAIESLEDLARAVAKDGYKCGCLKGTINCDTLMENLDIAKSWGPPIHFIFMKNSDLGDHLQIISDVLKSDDDNFVESVQEGLEKVLAEKYVFVAQQIGSIYTAQLMPDPNFVMSNEGLDIELFSLAFRKGSPYLKDINDMILRLSEAGLIAKWRDDVISLNNRQFARRKREVQDINPLSIEQLTGAIYMFGYGMLFGMIAFLFECIKSKFFN